MTAVDKVSYEVVTDPSDVGVVPERLEALLTRIHREVDAGFLPSCQLALAKDGKLVAFTTLGDATNDTRYVIYSATKPWVSMALLLLVQEGKVDVSKPVVEYIPAFGSNGKEAITLEQVMLHLGGFPAAPMGPPAWWSRETRLEQFAKWKLNYEPGTRYIYHPTSAHWVQAEIIEAVSGVPFQEFVQERVARRLGLDDFYLGEPKELQTGLEQVLCGDEATPDEIEAVMGVRALPLTEVTDDALMASNNPSQRALGIPGGGGVTTAATLALFYQHLLHDPTGLWDPDVLADAKTHVRSHVPDWQGNPAERTLAFITAGDDGKSNFRGMGKTVSPRAFGHNGAAGQLAWADPETGLSLGYCTNGIDRHTLRQGRRGVAISSLAAQCTQPV